MKSATGTFGILTSGGDCPGINAAIRGVCRAASETYGMRIIGFSNGFQGLIEGQGKELEPQDFSGILTRGGTILGTSREKPFKPDSDIRDSVAGRKKPESIRKHYDSFGLDCLVVIGGNGTHKTADLLRKEGLNVIGLPKTIDNDIWGTDVTFGFHSAVDIATEAIDRIHSTAHSHNRVMVVETMGHKAGWLSLYAGIAGGGDVILLPEIPYDIDIIAGHVMKRGKAGKQFSIVVVAEGAVSRKEAEDSGKKKKVKKLQKEGTIISRGYLVADELARKTGMECRVTVLGYQQRGGTPSAYDRFLATRFGTAAADLLHRGEYGNMVAMTGNEITVRPLEEVGGKLKTVPPDSPVIRAGRLVGTCFGETVPD